MVQFFKGIIERYEDALENLNKMMHSFGLECVPEEVNNLKGDAARAEFINKFKEVQRLKTQLDQYTDLTEEQAGKINQLLPEDDLRSFRSMYIETAQRLKTKQDKAAKKGDEDIEPNVEQLDFELVLFASTIIDYDYIMGLIAEMTQKKPSKQKVTKQQLINLLTSNANLMDEREDIIAYINSLDMDKPLEESNIREGYELFKREKNNKDLAIIAENHGVTYESLQAFVAEIMDRMVFDGEKLTDFLAPLGLNWKVRAKKELALMEDLVPFLNKLAQGREISGLYHE